MMETLTYRLYDKDYFKKPPRRFRLECIVCGLLKTDRWTRPPYVKNVKKHNHNFKLKKQKMVSYEGRTDVGIMTTSKVFEVQ